MKKRSVKRTLGLSVETFTQYECDLTPDDFGAVAAEMDAEGTAYLHQRELVYRIADECLKLAGQVPVDAAEPYPELARRLRGLAEQAKLFATDDNEASLIRAGYALGCVQQMLEHNVAHLKDVQGRQKSKGNLRPRKRLVTDEQIRAVLKKFDTRSKQANALGITERQLVRRLSRL